MNVKKLRIVICTMGIVAGIVFIILGIDLLNLYFNGWSMAHYETFGGDFYTSIQNVGVDIVSAVISLGRFLDSCIGGFGGFSIAIGITTILHFTLKLTDNFWKKEKTSDITNKLELLKQYKELLDCNIISQEEFEAKKKQFLD